MIAVLKFWIPGAPRPRNNRGRTKREQMGIVKRERERAQLKAHSEACAWRFAPVTGPARIEMLVLRRRLLDSDHVDDSCVNYRNGVANALLPHGDGPRTPYVWERVQQCQCEHAGAEGVLVKITRL